MSFTQNRLPIKPILKDFAYMTMPTVVILSVANPCTLHHFGNSLVRGANKQMNVVWHQTPSQNGNVGSTRFFLKRAKIAKIIGIIFKDYGSSYAALCEVDVL